MKLVTVHADNSWICLVSMPSIGAQVDDAVNSDTDASEPHEALDNVCASLYQEYEAMNGNLMESVHNGCSDLPQNRHVEAAESL